jgi:hypothetical protein
MYYFTHNTSELSDKKHKHSTSSDISEKSLEI